jgi:hypothetical protein
MPTQKNFDNLLSDPAIFAAVFSVATATCAVAQEVGFCQQLNIPSYLIHVDPETVIRHNLYQLLGAAGTWLLARGLVHIPASADRDLASSEISWLRKLAAPFKSFITSFPWAMAMLYSYWSVLEKLIPVRLGWVVGLLELAIVMIVASFVVRPVRNFNYAAVATLLFIWGFGAYFQGVAEALEATHSFLVHELEDGTTIGVVRDYEDKLIGFSVDHNCHLQPAALHIIPLKDDGAPRSFSTRCQPNHGAPPARSLKAGSATSDASRSGPASAVLSDTVCADTDGTSTRP